MIEDNKSKPTVNSTILCVLVQIVDSVIDLSDVNNTTPTVSLARSRAIPFSSPEPRDNSSPA